MFGAENRGRTDTMFPSRDFKSLASAYSAIPACVLSFSSQPSARRSLCRRRDEYGSSVCLFRHSGILSDIALRAVILLPMATVLFALCASDIAPCRSYGKSDFPLSLRGATTLRRGNLSERIAPCGWIPTLALEMTSKNDIALRAVKEKINLPCGCYVRK